MGRKDLRDAMELFAMFTEQEIEELLISAREKIEKRVAREKVCDIMQGEKEVCAQ